MDDKTKGYQKQRNVITKKFHTAIGPMLNVLYKLTAPDRVESYLASTQMCYLEYRNAIEALGPPGYFGGEEVE